MPGWQKYCDMPAPDFIHSQWERYPEAGVCIAHGAVIGLDLDTDRPDVAQALHRAIEPPSVRRRGGKGWMGYYRPGAGLEHLTARVRWYDGAAVAVELLLHGTQSVLPPTIHPTTGQPYQWVTPDTLENTDISELPVFTGREFEALDREFAAIGLTRQAPRKVGQAEFARPSPTAHDLEKPFGRSLNDRAMEPAAIDLWWPALGLPKSRQRGVGAWEGVAFWRGSNSGRAVHDRNPNLRATPSGIRDFGDDRPYTPLDLVMAARDCDFQAAADFLKGYVRPEFGAELALDQKTHAPQVEPEKTATVQEQAAFDPARWGAAPVFPGRRSYSSIKPVVLPTQAEWDALLPRDAMPFPIGDFSACEGLLGEVAAHIEASSPTMTEAGALAVALPVLGAAFGRAYASPTNLRTNIYTVAIGGSGEGKTSLVNPAKELMIMAGLGDVVGSDRMASGGGLLAMLSANPRRVCFLDEFGHMLQQIGMAGTGAHAKQILTEFTALYSGAMTEFKGTAYAAREPAPIDCPHLCLFGMATPEQFWRAFGSAALEDGSVARYLVFPLGKTAPKDPDTSAAEFMANELRATQAVIAGRVTGNLGRPQVYTVPMTDAAEKTRAALKAKETAFALFASAEGMRGAPSILRRVTENAIKIAMISAIGRNPSTPEIDGRDMDIGHAIAWWSAQTMIANIASHIADNQIERDVNDVERFILDGGAQGRAWSDVQRKFRRIRTRELQEIVDGLTRQETIVCEMTDSGRGRPGKRYKDATK